ncbi:MAG TPA: alpha/beta hydrolase [Streptosporangiaceae bacterium]|jgi:pimeloyl-ACP methyl ester carboxylesterase|nr:alpha/beta hydrolase [Streptosporangiaceae bacterium]
MAEAGFTSRNVEIGGLKFHYTDWGGGGPPLVMLHGLSGHARTWDHTAAALSERYRVLALDQRGHGDSDWAPQYGLAPMAQDVLGFLDALELAEVTLMGLSMGGLVSFVFAAAHPDRVTRMVIMDIGPEIAPVGARNVASSMAANDVFESEDEAFARARAANPRPTDATLRHRVSHNLRPLPDGTLTFKYDKALRSPGALFDHTQDELWAAWRAVSCPVLLVRGDDSDVLATETAQRMLAENPGASFASIPDCGHSITLDSPQGLLEVVSPWLAAAGAGRAASA